jgi:hypothetical protein
VAATRLYAVSIRGQSFAVLAGGTGKFADIDLTIINADVAIYGNL